ncbi:MAG TPA: heavy metal-associated domain-containing protein [Treponemataceae bacterium]|nr:heavy metal-associated domain-containing protein [Treponemataceae bacterium]HOQ92046.1 heavy metal-associated domain-containing protein [Treponemataceae bacterium]
MEKKIYVAGMTGDECEAKVNTAVSAIAGVQSCVSNAMKAQILVNFDESVAGIEEAITTAIAGCGYDVLN